MCDHICILSIGQYDFGFPIVYLKFLVAGREVCNSTADLMIVDIFE